MLCSTLASFARSCELSGKTLRLNARPSWGGAHEEAGVANRDAALFFRRATSLGVFLGTLFAAAITLGLMYFQTEWFSVWFNIFCRTDGTRCEVFGI